MPPLPRLICSSAVELEHRARSLPRHQIIAVIGRLEALPQDLDPQISYPWEWVLHRVLGQAGAETTGVLVPGSALLLDLSALAERLCDAIGLTPAELPPGSRTADDLCRAWGVSRKTLDRYRRRGLIARRVRTDDGRCVLAFAPHVVDAFARAHQSALSRAGRYRRIAGTDEARILRWARTYRRRLGCSRSGAARRIALRLGRSHEGVRQVLLRHDADAPDPIFGRPQAPASRRRRVAFRALARGIEPGDLARRWNRSTASVVRLALEHRASLLRSLDLPDEPGEPDIAPLLEPQPVGADLGAPGATDLLEFLRTAREPHVPIAFVETARARAYHALLRAAGREIASLPTSGAPASAIDRVETRLRWAARLKAELVRASLPLAVRTLETHLGHPLERARTADLLRLLRGMLDAVSEGVERFDPSRGGRLAGPVSLAVTRFASRAARSLIAPLQPGKAAPQVRPGVPIPDWTRAVAPWQTWLEPDPRVRSALPALDDRARRALTLRHGWGPRPHTTEDLARALETTPMRAAVMERRALRAALRIARERP